MDDKDRILDSITHLGQRAEKMRTASQEAAHAAAHAEENRIAQAEYRDRAARLARADELETQIVSIVSEKETRDMLLDRIRKMREEKPPEIVHETYRSPAQQEQFELEQKAGREAVARLTAEAERYKALQAKADEEERAKSAVMVPVHHPNPDMDEQFPAIKATLGPKKK